MNRKETTKILTDIVTYSLRDRKYYAKEVTLDYGTTHSKRIDIMQFSPKGTTYSSDIEKGIFTCYEVKSCVEDIYSGHGLNFYGEKNYIVITMDTYKQIQDDYRSGKLGRYIIENYPESSKYWGILVPVPDSIDLRDSNAIFKEYENPTDFTKNIYNWKLYCPIPCREGHRTRSTVELLFCMLRSKHNN